DALVVDPLALEHEPHGHRRMRAGDHIERRAVHAANPMRIIAAVLLAIDVGNTQTHFGIFEGDTLVEHWRVATEAEATTDELAVLAGGLLGLRGIGFDAISGTIVSSVVPQLTPGYAEMSDRYL